MKVPKCQSVTAKNDPNKIIIENKNTNNPFE